MSDPEELKPEDKLGDVGPNVLGTWMQLPPDVAENIESLHWLDDLDHLLVYSFTPPKAMRTFPAAADRHFIIRNNRGENVFVANEYAGKKKVCGNRSFSVDVLDKESAIVFSIKSPTNCGICCGCCVPWIEIFTKEHIMLGTIEQKCSIFQQKYMLRDKAGRAQLRVRGPLLPLFCLKHPELSVLSKSGPLEKGLIVKVGDKNRCEMEVLFSKFMNPEMKAAMLAMAFVFEIRNFKPTKEPPKPAYQLSRPALSSKVALIEENPDNEENTQ